ncbi:MAG: SsrA-binding protein [Candidatus Portnoybacteria bacterium RBG_13_40_8]|uniref:SsrA-binding protein n=1 Tax=Candidatus Portnoybacteria bacterium RBG_13_40_8 TaxID=1801990 RepID=A0A1G2F476_9BACT|nr:MAG: SsrA-binding protein [Candidatus Portnoybacteria bacterium RBG_13_40_8]OGZ34680.1 MAG: SsrA-binding protein [Candidatus Portnoybacteria bacterium RIFCSPHIGHO2_01_FULL_39_19]
MKILAENKRAKFDYELLETYEAGLVLRGFEVKAIKTGHVNLLGSYVVGRESEFYLINAFIPSYQPSNTPEDYDPYRSRKLLLKKNEINSLIGKGKTKGLTLIPIKIYTKKSRIKLEFAVGKGKRKIDKREIIKKRDMEREAGRRFKN